MADSRMVVSMKFRRSAALFVLELTAARFWTTIASSGDDRPDAGLAEQAREGGSWQLSRSGSGWSSPTA